MKQFSKALVVEDQEAFLAIITRLFRQIGIRDVVGANGGAEAWQQLEAADPPFDLVFCDLNMPGVSGIDLLEKVRKDPRFGEIPFILTTSHGTAKAAMLAEQHDADGLLVEPFSSNQLQDCLKRIRRG